LSKALHQGCVVSARITVTLNSKVFTVGFDLFNSTDTFVIDKCQTSETLIGGTVCREFESEVPIHSSVIGCYAWCIDMSFCACVGCGFFSNLDLSSDLDLSDENDAVW